MAIKLKLTIDGNVTTFKKKESKFTLNDMRSALEYQHNLIVYQTKEDRTAKDLIRNFDSLINFVVVAFNNQFEVKDVLALDDIDKYNTFNEWVNEALGIKDEDGSGKN